MIKLSYKTDKERNDMASGEISIRLVKIIYMLMEYLSLSYPDYIELTITDVLRSQEQQDKIYLNSTVKGQADRYKKKPWQSVHQYGRGIDIRTNDMPNGLAKKCEKLLNCIPYDKKRPRIKTCKLHDVGTGSHLHLQVIS